MSSTLKPGLLGIITALWCCTNDLSAQVTIDLRVLEGNLRAGEGRPVRGESIWMFPYAGDPQLKKTNESGSVRFSLSPTASFKLWIRNPPRQIELYQMSGNFSQSTSAFIDTGLAFGSDDQVVIRTQQFLNELSDSFRRRKPPENVKRELKSMRDEILNGANVDLPERFRRDVIQQIDGLLSIRDWKLGVSCNYTDNGAVITNVQRNGVAEKYGINVGDRIVSVDGRPVGKTNGQTILLPEAFKDSRAGLVELEIVQGSRNSRSARILRVQLEE